MKTEPLKAGLVSSSQAPAYAQSVPSGEWRVILVISALLAGLFFITAQPINQADPSSRTYFALTSALALDHSPAIDNYITLSGPNTLATTRDVPDAAYYKGHYYAAAAPGGAILALPFYQLGALFGSTGAAAFSLGLVALAGAATVLITYATSRRLGSAIVSARFGALMLALASGLWREAGRFGPEIFSFLLMALALWLVLPPLPQLTLKGSSIKFTVGHSLALGLVLGLAVTVDYPDLLWTPVFGIYLLSCKRVGRSGWSFIVAGWLAGVGLLGLYNWLIMGQPWTFTYGFLLDNPAARSLSGQLLGGFQLGNIRDVFFSPDRALSGPFVILFGGWGLAALYGQRGKRPETVLLVTLVVVSLILGLLRPAGSGVERAGQAAAGMLPPLALGVSVWHERFQFLTRLEQWWLPGLALGGVGLYYWLAAPGPLANISEGFYLLPVAGLIGGIGLFWRFIPKIGNLKKGAVLALALALFCLAATLMSGTTKPTYAGSVTNNLLYNGQLSCFSGQITGWYTVNSPLKCSGAALALQTGDRLQPYLAGVQGGHVYQLQFEGQAQGQLDWLWLDEEHEPVDVPGGTFTRAYQGTFNLNSGGLSGFKDSRAAPPGAAYLQLVLTLAGTGSISNFSLHDSGVRLEPLQHYATAALAFTFDWESAMGGLIHSKGGAPVAGESESGGVGLSAENLQAALKDAERRGLNMRAGADFLLQLFADYGLRGTFYGNGYNLLDSNSDKLLFAGNPTYKWANTANRWADDFWTKNPWYRFDPYGSLKGHEAWYFGDQTDRLREAGQDIQSHTFGHIYLRGTTVEEFRQDTEAFLQVARQKQLPPIRHFAFPWKSSNSLTKEWYAVLANQGFSSVSRLYDPDQRILQESDGRLLFDNGQRTATNSSIYEPTAGPNNPYYYLSRVKDESRLAILHDYQLVPGRNSELAARALIDELRRRRGYGSIWTHPEAIVSPEDQAQWTRVVQYAVQQRAEGLQVDSVTNLIQHRHDAGQVNLQTSWRDNGQRASLTLTNRSSNRLEGLTLTLPATVASAGGAAGFKGTQILAPVLAGGQTVTIEVTFT